VEDFKLVVLKKEIEEIKKINEQLKKLLKAKGDEKFFIIIENLVKVDSKINETLANSMQLLKLYTSLIKEVEEIKDMNKTILERFSLFENEIKDLKKEIKELKGKK
jgi:chromosome segregation ATPase